MQVFKLDLKNRVHERFEYWAMVYPKANPLAYSFVNFTSEYSLEAYIKALKVKGTHGGFGMIQNQGIEERIIYV